MVLFSKLLILRLNSNNEFLDCNLGVFKIVRMIVIFLVIYKIYKIYREDIKNMLLIVWIWLVFIGNFLDFYVFFVESF